MAVVANETSVASASASAMLDAASTSTPANAPRHCSAKAAARSGERS